MCFHFCICFFSCYSCRYLVSITVVIREFKLIIAKKKKKKLDKIVWPAKTKLNTVEVLISKALIDSNINHDEFVSLSNVLREYGNIKEEIKNSNDK